MQYYDNKMRVAATRCKVIDAAVLEDEVKLNCQHNITICIMVNDLAK